MRHRLGLAVAGASPLRKSNLRVSQTMRPSAALTSGSFSSASLPRVASSKSRLSKAATIGRIAWLAPAVVGVACLGVMSALGADAQPAASSAAAPSSAAKGRRWVFIACLLVWFWMDGWVPRCLCGALRRVP